MARGDGIHRTNARNMRLTAVKIGNAQQHNEWEKESYVNQDIVPERTQLNVHFKEPTGSYAEMFQKLKEDGVISTRGLKEDAFLYGELIFDVNTAYFHNHGGHARRRAQPRHVRRAGAGRAPLSPSCGLHSRRGKANPVVETLQG